MIEVGDRVVFDGFGQPDPYSDLQPGTGGTVDHVDDWGTVHVKWDSGGSLGMVTRPWFAGQPDFRPDRFHKEAD
jgi:hypothetical protein